MTLTDVAQILGNTIENNSIFQGISIDSRTLVPGNLFVAIQGDQFDGHDYIQDAEKKGAVGLVVSRKVTSSLPQIIVQNTTDSLGFIATTWRQHFTIPFVAVTGSNGKTTTKNMLAAIMQAACNNNESEVLATKGTLNNHWGLPLTLFNLNDQHRYAVIEMGMNHFGEIEYLTKLTKPNVAIITNASAAHLQGVGDLAGVAKAKSEIFLGLPTDGIAILNRDDAFYHYWCVQVGKHQHISFGLTAGADVTADLHDAALHQHLTLHTPSGHIDINLPLLGKHNILNALAAAAAAIAIGIDLSAIKTGLEATIPAPGRLQLHTLINGVNIIDDTYNANPYSLQAAVDTLASFAGKKILVLGDMRELGDTEKTLHGDAGEKIRAAGIDFLFTYGNLSENASYTFGEGAYHFTEQDKLVDALKPFLYNQTTILVKGSRSMHMEKVIAGLVA